jgi:hypothetical protein
MMPLVVNLFGGPGSGKSTTMAGLFSQMKLLGMNVEMAPEWIKGKVYEGTPYPPKDQIYVFAKQRKTLMQLLDTVGIIITDSPLLLSILYDKDNNKVLHELIKHEYLKFNNMNFMLRRVKPYSPVGRYQSEDGARLIDAQLVTFMRELGVPYVMVDGDEAAPRQILERVKMYMHG